MDLKFKFQRNEETQLQKLFARHHRRQNRKHIVDEKIEVQRAKKEAIYATQNFKKTGQFQIATQAVSQAAKRPMARFANKANYELQKSLLSIQSALLYLYYSLLDSLDSVKQRKAIYIACAVMIAFSATGAALADWLFGYKIILNGYDIGYVRHIATFNNALEQADSRFREWYHNDTIFYERTITKISTFIGGKRGSLLGEAECLEKIFASNIPIYAQGGVIMVDNQEAYRLASVAEAEAVKESLAANLGASENVVSETVVYSNPQQDVTVIAKTVEMTSVKSVEDAVEELLSPETALEPDIAVSSPGFMGNYENENKGLITSLNFRKDEFAVGEVATKPKVTFNTMKLVKYTEPVRFLKEYKNDSTLLQGTTKVIQDGKNGTKQIEAVITYANNIEVSRTISSEDLVEAPINQVIARGTKEIEVISDGTGSGGYIIPLSGRISSFTANRSGSHADFHAIDIACPVGTSVAASKDGTVALAETYGDYGKCVIIKHADGYATLYAHLSKFLVTAGDTVRQGQIVADSGNTGRTTGPHLHFEIRKNDTRLDLRNFFSVKEGDKIKAGLKSN